MAKKLKKELKWGSFRNDWEKVMLNFQLTQIKLNAHLKAFFKGFGITAQQFNVLRLISESEKESVSNIYLKERLVEKDADISRLLNRLVEQDLIERSPNPVDKRQSNIRLSEKGAALHNRISGELHHADRFFYALSRKELKSFNSLLDKLRNS